MFRYDKILFDSKSRNELVDGGKDKKEIKRLQVGEITISFDRDFKVNVTFDIVNRGSKRAPGSNVEELDKEIKTKKRPKHKTLKVF